MKILNEKEQQAAKEILEKAAKEIWALGKDDGRKPLTADERMAREKKWREEHKEFFESINIEDNFIKSHSLIEKFDKDIADALYDLLDDRIANINGTLWNIVESVVERDSVPETEEKAMEDVRRNAEIDGLRSQKLDFALKNFKYSSVIEKGPFDFEKINHVFDVYTRGNSDIQEIANLLTFSLLQKTVWSLAKRYGYDKAQISSTPALKKDIAK